MTTRSAWTFTRSRFCRRWAFAASFSLAACAEGRPEVGPGDVRTLRVLAVKSEPADPLPGKPAVLSAVLQTPREAQVGLVWAAVDPSSVLPSAGAPRGSLQAGSFAFAGLVTPPVVLPRPTQPAFPLAVTAVYLPAVTAPAGVTSVAVVLLARAGDIDVGRALDPETRNGYLQTLLDDVVPAVKVLRLGDSPPNQNPRIAAVRAVRRVYELDDATKRVKRGDPLDVFTVPSAGMIEMRADVEDESPLCETGDAKDYGKRGRSCVSFSWYAANGLLNGFVRATETWTAPRKAGIYTLVVVARDRIGGLDWYLQDVNVGRPAETGAAGRALVYSQTTEPGVTPAGRLLWLPIATAEDRERLETLRAAEREFTADVEMQPDAAARLHLNVTGWTFPSTATAPVSLQAAAERALSGTVPVRLRVQLVD